MSVKTEYLDEKTLRSNQRYIIKYKMKLFKVKQNNATL